MADVKRILGRMLPGSMGKPIAEKWYDYGVGLQRRNRFEEAVDAYTEAVNRDPQLVQAYSNRANANLILGEAEVAIRDADRALQISPNLAVAYSTRGHAHISLGAKTKMEMPLDPAAARPHFENAVRDLSRAIRINPRFAAAYSGRGFAHKEAGRLLAAIDDFSQAIRIDKRFPEAYNNRADVYIETGQLDLAIPDLNQAIRLEPVFAVAYVNRAIARTLLNEDEAARRDAETAARMGVDRRAVEDKINELKSQRRR